jgi:hypothetical protein
MHMVRLDRGEDVLAELTAYLHAHGICAGMVSGIGAVTDIEVGAYVLDEGRYEKVQLDGDHELLSFSGNIAMLDGAAFVHPHVVVSDREGHARGGHLFSAVVAITVELIIIESDLSLSRRMDDAVGLKLWSFDADD